MHGFLTAKGLNIECLGSYIDMSPCKQYNNLLNKFIDDQVLVNTDKQICFLEGYVYNKNEMKKKESDNWQETFASAVFSDPEKCLRALRGGFCGYNFNKQSGELVAFTDHVSVKALYYYVNDKQWILSNNFSYIVDVLKANGISYEFNDIAAQYMLSYGYMLDSNTFVKQVYRLMPGQCLFVTDRGIELRTYYFINNTEVLVTEQEAVEKIDKAFRIAVKREFEKDLEYGYQHLVDLSGGLDSRMVSWVAHDMGYTNQVNVTYSQASYLDEKISKKIACYLKHEYLFKALDDAKWMYDIEELTSKNNGAALYMGITGGSRLLEKLDSDRFGIEHTGMIGDAILSTFYHDRAFNFGKPRMGLHKYSERLSYKFDDAILKNYSCQEMFAIYTRGIMGAQSSYMIRQHYFETASPFMDVDFLETVFSIPFEYRKAHHIYMKWMLDKYPKSTDFGWEKWGGIKPKESHIFFRKIKTTQRLLGIAICKILKIENRDSMNPVDYWYKHDKNIQDFFEKYYFDNIDLVANEELRKDIKALFLEGNVTEKSMVLTVLAIVKKYFK